MLGYVLLMAEVFE